MNLWAGMQISSAYSKLSGLSFKSHCTTQNLLQQIPFIMQSNIKINSKGESKQSYLLVVDIMNYNSSNNNIETTWKGKYQYIDNKKIGKEGGNSYGEFILARHAWTDT